MIAANYRKYPEAMALQMPLPFGRVLVWALPRPTTRVLRAIRAARAATFKARGRIEYPTKAATPQWFKDQQKRAKALSRAVMASLLPILFVQTNQLSNTNGA